LTVADVLTYPGMGTNGGVPAPYLQNMIYPAGDGLGGRIALGMGRMTRRFDDLVSEEKEGGLTNAQLQALIVAAAQAGGAASNVINYNFEGLIGPPGPPGKTMVQYLQPPIGLGQVGSSGLTDIDIPVPYDGFEGAFTDDSPGAGSVAWTSFKIKYKGSSYTVAAGNTSNTYLYWNASSPTAISSSNTRTDAVGVGKFFIGRNNSGTFEQSQFIKLITAGFISVAQLSALAADLGTITAGSLTMNLGSTYRLRLSPTGLQGSNNSGQAWFGIVDLDGTDVIIQGTKLKLLSVATGAVANNAITAWDSASSASGSWYQSGTDVVTLEDFTISGGYIDVHGEVDIEADNWSGETVTVKLVRDSTTIVTRVLEMAASTRVSVTMNTKDNPGAGTYDYKINISAGVSGGDYWEADVFATNVKK
jgi:hypothetical protein